MNSDLYFGKIQIKFPGEWRVWTHQNFNVLRYLRFGNPGYGIYHNSIGVLTKVNGGEILFLYDKDGKTKIISFDEFKVIYKKNFGFKNFT